MAASTWPQRVDALGRGGYRRYDERTAAQLGELADVVLERYRGDLRRLRDSTADLSADLQQFKGIGAVGAGIFCRDVQAVWTEVAPYVDDLAADGAAALGLPRSPHRLAALAPTADVPELLAGCVPSCTPPSATTSAPTADPSGYGAGSSGVSQGQASITIFACSYAARGCRLSLL